MNSSTASAPLRQVRIDDLAVELAPQAALLTRLVVRQLEAALSRSEASLLKTLTGGPRRITELAELEGLAQPTMTLLVKRLEKQGLVARERQPEDGRVVIIRITPDGAAALATFLAQVSATMRAYLSEMSDEQIEALTVAAGALDNLIALLQERGR